MPDYQLSPKSKFRQGFYQLMKKEKPFNHRQQLKKNNPEFDRASSYSLIKNERSRKSNTHLGPNTQSKVSMTSTPTKILKQVTLAASTSNSSIMKESSISLLHNESSNALLSTSPHAQQQQFVSVSSITSSQGKQRKLKRGNLPIIEQMRMSRGSKEAILRQQSIEHIHQQAKLINDYHSVCSHEQKLKQKMSSQRRINKKLQDRSVVKRF